MNPLVASFHIDTVMLIAQAINFAVVFAVLYFFVIKPLMRVLDARTASVEKGIKEAEEATKKLHAAEEEYTTQLAKAQSEARKLLERVEKEGEKKRLVALEQLTEELVSERAEARKREATERELFRQEMRAEAVNIVTNALERILATREPSVIDNALIQKSLEDTRNSTL